MLSYLIIIAIVSNAQVFGSNSTFNNVTALTAGNDLWFGLVRDCQEPTVSCIKNSIYNFLKNTFDYDRDLNFTSFMKFSKNNIIYKTPINQSITTGIENNFLIGDESPFEEISRSLKDHSKKFLMTHDLELQLPDPFFLGATLKISPRNVDESGTMLNLQLIPKDLKRSIGEGRILGNLIGKIIKKYITDRLLYALLAILVVIKLLAVNVIFFLPSMLGVVTAKKLIVKVLLFLFPALHHLFKLCEYTPYGAKHHIHKHQIAHIHQVAGGYHHHKPHVEVYDEHPHHHGHGHEIDHHSHDYGHGHDHGHGYPEIDHYSEFAHKDDTNYGDDSYPAASYENEVYHKDPDESDNSLFGSGHSSKRPKHGGKKPMTATEIENMILRAEKEALIKNRLQKERQRIHEENLKLQDQLNTALKIQQKLKLHAAVATAKLKPGKKKPLHLLAPLIPPPLPSPVNQYPQNSFAEPPTYLPDVANSVHLTENSQPGEFAEPPTNFVAPTSNFVAPPTSFIEPIPPIKSSVLTPGILGAGLPGETVQAVQSFLSQKSVQNQKGIFPVYSVQQTEQFEVPEYTKKVNPQPVTEKQIVVHTQKVANSRKSDQLTPEEELYQAASITYDSFYSPILEKIDGVLHSLGFVEEPCKERLICSMYKNPEKFSPHSNLISAELSRDPKELKKPTSTNAAVIRFYKYVQAARDGQDQRDCIRLYPSCIVNTEV
ncbi:uncharacterized protein LOC114324586 [Diabrotica virgifera virgifera]|uniref:Uncharacterized protein n=1 Tax=Diabrotica virgifera virgifera TaxID=50390 RepID=A0ABM5I9Y5_DIAVI|nr:uncharacterized protein LOC114324586 [Diabrotica virgifera virgifera]